MSINQGQQLADLQHRIDELSRTVEQLQSELNHWRQDGLGHRAGSRRDLLRLAGGAAAAGVLAGVAVRTSPAHAASGEAMLLGRQHAVANITVIGYGTVIGTGPTPALTSEATMFWVDNRASPLSNANGIRADGKGGGAGLWGNNDSGGVGVLGSGGIGVRAAGNLAAVQLVEIGGPPASRTDTHVRGEIDIDLNGDLWVCTAAGTPGTWRKLAGPNTAGAFHAINPARVYDSRLGGIPIVAGENRLVRVADALDLATGLVDVPNVIPSGAIAITYNLTITQTVAIGFLTVAPGGATAVTSSSINWRGDGLDIANALIVPVDSSRRVRVFAGGNGSTHFLIDVSGYFL